MSSASIIKIEVRSLACPVRQLRALRVEGAAHTLKTKLLRIPFDVRVQNEARVLLETQVEPQLEWQHLRGQSNGLVEVQAACRRNLVEPISVGEFVLELNGGVRALAGVS